MDVSRQQMLNSLHHVHVFQTTQLENYTEANENPLYFQLVHHHVRLYPKYQEETRGFLVGFSTMTMKTLFVSSSRHI